MLRVISWLAVFKKRNLEAVGDRENGLQNSIPLLIVIDKRLPKLRIHHQ